MRMTLLCLHARNDLSNAPAAMRGRLVIIPIDAPWTQKGMR